MNILIIFNKKKKQPSTSIYFFLANELDDFLSKNFEYDQSKSLRIKTFNKSKSINLSSSSSSETSTATTTSPSSLTSSSSSLSKAILLNAVNNQSNDSLSNKQAANQSTECLLLRNQNAKNISLKTNQSNHSINNSNRKELVIVVIVAYLCVCFIRIVYFL